MSKQVIVNIADEDLSDCVILILRTSLSKDFEITGIEDLCEKDKRASLADECLALCLHSYAVVWYPELYAQDFFEKLSEKGYQGIKVLLTNKINKAGIGSADRIVYTATDHLMGELVESLKDR